MVVVDHAEDAVGAQQQPLGERQRQHEEVGVGAARATDRAGHHVALGVGGHLGLR